MNSIFVLHMARYKFYMMMMMMMMNCAYRELEGDGYLSPSPSIITKYVSIQKSSPLILYSHPQQSPQTIVPIPICPQKPPHPSLTVPSDIHPMHVAQKTAIFDKCSYYASGIKTI